MFGETSYKINCPICRERGSFSVTRTAEGILFNCFRIKCGYRGFIPLNQSIKERTYKDPKKDLDTKDFIDCSPEQRIFFWEKFGIEDSTLYVFGVSYSPGMNRFIFPVYVPNFPGVRAAAIGYVCRSYNPLESKKVLLYWNKDIDETLPKAYYTTGHMAGRRKIVVVEDVISALKIKQEEYDSVALLGTNMSPQVAKSLINQDVILWLDNDARAKALVIKRKYGFIFNKLSILSTEKDPKDLPREEMIQILHGATTN